MRQKWKNNIYMYVYIYNIYVWVELLFIFVYDYTDISWIKWTQNVEKWKKNVLFWFAR